jgi:hypothetical protein
MAWKSLSQTPWHWPRMVRSRWWKIGRVSKSDFTSLLLVPYFFPLGVDNNH